MSAYQLNLQLFDRQSSGWKQALGQPLLTSTFPVAPPQLSEEEIRQAEAEANFTIQQAVATTVALYLCKLH